MHAVTPSFGQGACLAMEDAFALAREIGAKLNAGPEEIAEALRRYETERFPRTFQAQIGSYVQGEKSYGRHTDEFDNVTLNFDSEGGIVSWLHAWKGETIMPPQAS
eukprot:gnl/TRDRNA2_/TRDRNA2_82004_c0_seq2.p1 gnl/TRDRNA2_/TRDRNA2_82004_c0~~gnl/TRDRNA2_/TRDRNA2_82004_c0_seq2.p1  ORF type:complete len:106 (+),score=22.38 gnl/TRDRNA2_/TRDRNA2_82004_c0_seq2:39-356(+)